MAPAAPISARVCGIAAMSRYVWSSVMITTTLGLRAARGRPRAGSAAAAAASAASRIATMRTPRQRTGRAVDAAQVSRARRITACPLAYPGRMLRVLLTNDDGIEADGPAGAAPRAARGRRTSSSR